ncbi:MAG: 16S rRNA (guanine(527)-N(7))-methyltransferase RsmG [Bacteroidota bacterium]
MQIIHQYFPNLTPTQVKQLEALQPLYQDWNSKINVISRKDIDKLYERHILHSMALGIVLRFEEGAEILDLGTGGGMPGIPLAILFPDVKFTLIDGTGKKIRVVQEIIQAIDLKNANAQQIRAEELKGKKFDFIVSRAVASLDKLIPWSKRLLKRKHRHAYPNGLFALKGGNIQAEIEALPHPEYTEVFPLSELFDLEFYEEKCLVYVQG